MEKRTHKQKNKQTNNKQHAKKQTKDKQTNNKHNAKKQTKDK